ncbi:hypothetical protein KKF86_01715, partial [bacterium]|nr:hypothetical protein [bacterium]
NKILFNKLTYNPSEFFDLQLIIEHNKDVRPVLNPHGVIAYQPKIEISDIDNIKVYKKTNYYKYFITLSLIMIFTIISILLYTKKLKNEQIERLSMVIEGTELAKVAKKLSKKDFYKLAEETAGLLAQPSVKDLAFAKDPLIRELSVIGEIPDDWLIEYFLYENNFEDLADIIEKGSERKIKKSDLLLDWSNNPQKPNNVRRILGLPDLVHKNKSPISQQ